VISCRNIRRKGRITTNLRIREKDLDAESTSTHLCRLNDGRVALLKHLLVSVGQLRYRVYLHVSTAGEIDPGWDKQRFEVSAKEITLAAPLELHIRVGVAGICLVSSRTFTQAHVHARIHIL
jgi:hypothetical protein